MGRVRKWIKKRELTRKNLMTWARVMASYSFRAEEEVNVLLNFLMKFIIILVWGKLLGTRRKFDYFKNNYAEKKY